MYTLGPKCNLPGVARRQSESGGDRGIVGEDRLQRRQTAAASRLRRGKTPTRYAYVSTYVHTLCTGINSGEGWYRLPYWKFLWRGAGREKLKPQICLILGMKGKIWCRNDRKRGITDELGLKLVKIGH